MAGEYEFYGATGFIGGAQGDIDNIPVAGLAAGDRLVHLSATLLIPYNYQAAIGGVENSPWLIAPDDAGGNERWEMIGMMATGFEASVASGDPKIVFDIGGTDEWYIGVDDDDGDKLKIGTGAAVGTNTIIEVSSAAVEINPAEQDVDFIVNASGLADALNVRGSDGLISIAAGQIKFPAVQNPSADANTLDDYEEGTLDLVVSSGFSVGPTYTTKAGFYTKVGDTVHFWGRLTLAGGTADGNNFQIDTPFAVSALTNFTCSGAVSVLAAAGLTDGICTSLWTFASQTMVRILVHSTTSYANQVGTQLGNAANLSFEITYKI